MWKLMYAVKEMHTCASEQIIYLSQHTESGIWKWDVVNGRKVCGYAVTLELAYSQAIVAAGWIDVEYWRKLAG